METRSIYCVGCEKKVHARLTSGEEIYSHRPDLYSLPFWQCDLCGNYVGCHHKTKNRTQPLGCIPTPQMRTIRKKIHAIIDPIYTGSKTISRHTVYKMMTVELNNGFDYHTAQLRTIKDAMLALRAAEKISLELSGI